jgi:MFS transporter, putative metabolite:H+ symporter
MTAASSIGVRLDRLPLSGFHYRLLGLIAAGMFFDSFDIYIAGAVLAAIINSGESTLQLNAAFVSATFIGMMTGAWLSGILGDRFGRRFSYQFNLGIYGFASLAAALSPSMYWLIFFRLVMGVGMGAEIVIGYGTLSEFIPAAWRGRFGTILNLLINTSLFLATFLGWLIIPHYGWRWMFVIAGAGALVVWFLRKSMRESPRWLASRGRMEEAQKIVSDIERACGVVANAAVRVADMPMPEASVEEAAHWSDLFSRRLLRRTITGITVLAALFTVNFAFVSWIPTFLVKQGHSISNSLGLTTLMFAGGPVGSLIAFALASALDASGELSRSHSSEWCAGAPIRLRNRRLPSSLPDSRSPAASTFCRRSAWRVTCLNCSRLNCVCAARVCAIRWGAPSTSSSLTRWRLHSRDSALSEW